METALRVGNVLNAHARQLEKHSSQAGGHIAVAFHQEDAPHHAVFGLETT